MTAVVVARIAVVLSLAWQPSVVLVVIVAPVTHEVKSSRDDSRDAAQRYN